MTSKLRPILQWISAKALNWAVLVSFTLFILCLYRYNYPGLRELNISPLPFLALFGLCLLLLVMKLKPRLRWQPLLIFLGILTAVVAVKLPILNHLGGYFNSDDSIFGLMSRHFLQGQPAPLFFYGQLYLGSGYMLINALFSGLLGQSVLGLGLTALVLFSLFIFIQYRWTAEFLDRYTAYGCIAFYVFSGGILMQNIFSVGGNFPLVYVLGALILFLTLKIVIKGESHYIYILGFIIGFGYWNHQITLVFALLSILLILLKRNLKQIGALAVSGLLGLLPFLLFEVSHHFVNLRFIFRGSRDSQVPALSPPKWHHLVQGLIDIFPPDTPLLLALLFYGIVLGGIIWAVYRTVKLKKISVELVIALNIVLFVLIYLSSQFSKSYIPRYFMPLYLLLPALLIRPLPLKRGRLRFILGIPVLLVLMGFGLFHHLSFGRRLERLEGYRQALYNRLRGAGVDTWYAATYRDSYLFSLMSGEEMVVSNGQLERYLPYLLRLYNSPQRHIYLIGSRGRYFKKKLDTYGVAHDYEETRLFRLFSHISAKINLPDWRGKILSRLPEILIKAGVNGQVRLVVNGQGLSPQEARGVRLNVQVQNSEYTSLQREPLGLPPNPVAVAVPACFQGNSLRVTAWLDHNGSDIPATKITETIAVPALEAPAGTIYLNGFSPAVNDLAGQYRTRDPRFNNEVHVEGEALRVMEKEAVLLWRPTDAAGKQRLVLTVHSLIDFDRPIWRYLGLYQELSITLNHHSRTYKLTYGPNRIVFPLPAEAVSSAAPFLDIHFKTKYVLPFKFGRLGYYETGLALSRRERDF
jgi:hypothetical protein